VCRERQPAIPSVLVADPYLDLSVADAGVARLVEDGRTVDESSAAEIEAGSMPGKDTGLVVSPVAIFADDVCASV
jgi:hypothetical protein